MSKGINAKLEPFFYDYWFKNVSDHNLQIEKDGRIMQERISLAIRR
jgi:hypothetical protein